MIRTLGCLLGLLAGLSGASAQYAVYGMAGGAVLPSAADDRTLTGYTFELGLTRRVTPRSLVFAAGDLYHAQYRADDELLEDQGWALQLMWAYALPKLFAKVRLGLDAGFVYVNSRQTSLVTGRPGRSSTRSVRGSLQDADRLGFGANLVLPLYGKDRFGVFSQLAVWMLPYNTALQEVYGYDIDRLQLLVGFAYSLKARE